MQSGLARLGLMRALALLVSLLLLATGLHVGTRHYCAAANLTAQNTTTTLAHARHLHAAMQGARTALQNMPKPLENSLSDSEDFGRWLHETGNQHYLQLQQLTIRNEQAADPLKPVIRATFRVEAPLLQIILLLHNLQRFPRLVCYDTLHLHHGSPDTPQRYVADITLHMYALPIPPPPTSPVNLPATPSTPEQISADLQKVALIGQKADIVQKRLQAASAAINLAERITVLPPPLPPPTNNSEVAIAPPTPPPPPPPPAPEPLFVLRGISFSDNKPLTLLNNRWRQTGELVSSNGGWYVGGIEPTRVILINTQGVKRVIPFFSPPPPPSQTAQARTP